MARPTNRLNARSVVGKLRPGLHADGDGLYLNVKASGARSWSFVYQFAKKRREMGLGPLSSVPLADARRKAVAARALVAEGIDPVHERKADAARASSGNSFGEVADKLIIGLTPGWKNPKHAQQWRNTLETHARSLQALAVDRITTNDVLEVLQPIWSTVPETANRVRGRIERVLDASKVRGLRSGDNPALWKGHLSLLLPPRPNKSQQRHHPAMPFAEVGGFVARLRKLDGSTSARALEFMILTAARTTEVLDVTWQELDLEQGLWIVPANRMKGGAEHRVPLSSQALAVVTTMRTADSDEGDYVFPGLKANRPLSNMAMGMQLRRLKHGAVTVHGFRSSFRDWAGELTDFPRELAEASLAHAVGNEVERAYRRGTAIDKRRVMMNAWAEYLDQAA